MMNQTIGYLAAGLFFVNIFNPEIISAQDNEDRIQPFRKNPYYWQYKGEPVLLLGGSRDDNLFQIPQLKEHLEAISDAGGNYIRNTMSDRPSDSERPESSFEVYPFKKLDNGAFDLDRWNETYWQRFENMLEWTYERDIIVQVEIWDRFDYSRDNWPPHPYNPANNINYSYEESGFEPVYPEHPGANKQPFFFTTPEQRHNKIVLRYQHKFVNKLLDFTLEYPHVLYCIDNETSGEEAWSVYWAEFVRKRAEKENKAVQITEMWDDWDLTEEEHRRTLDHPERFDYVDVSQNNHQTDETHWQNFLWVRDYIGDQPRPVNSVKIYGSDGGRHGGGNRDAVEKIWRLIFAGGASARFHRPDSGIGLSELAQTQLRSARMFLEHFNIFRARPDADHQLLSDREEDEAYLSYIEAEKYAVFFTGGGDVNLELPDKENGNPWQVQWLNIPKSKWEKPEPVSEPGSVRLDAPGDGQWVALVSKK